MAKKVLITGGLGYFGVKLANYLAANPEALSWKGKNEVIDKIDLFDIVDDSPNKKLLDQEHEIYVTDLSEQDKSLKLIVYKDYDTIFHFGGAPSGACQKDPSIGTKNFDATKTVLEAASELYEKDREETKVIFPSSLLAFENINDIEDDTEPNAEMPYGKAKRLSEYLGVGASNVDFRALRVSTVIARREPSTAVTAYNYNLPNLLLNGKDCVIPVEKNFVHPIIWIDDVILGFVNLHNLDEKYLVDENQNPRRVFNVTSHSLRAEDLAKMVESYKDKLPWKIGKVIWEKGNEEELKILNSAGKYMKGNLASRLKIVSSTNTKDMIKNIYDEILKEKESE